MTEWKEIPNTGGAYAASTEGEIKRLKSARGARKGHILKPLRVSSGYLKVNLSINNEKTQRTIHKLVLETFVGPCPSPKHCVNHKNGNKHDNRLSNLEYVTYAENTNHAYHVLKRDCAYGSAKSQLTDGDISEIKRRAKTGEIQKSIAGDFNISRVQVSRIVNGKSWVRHK